MSDFCKENFVGGGESPILDKITEAQELNNRVAATIDNLREEYSKYIKNQKELRMPIPNAADCVGAWVDTICPVDGQLCPPGASGLREGVKNDGACCINERWVGGECPSWEDYKPKQKVELEDKIMANQELIGEYKNTINTLLAKIDDVSAVLLRYADERYRHDNKDESKNLVDITSTLATNRNKLQSIYDDMDSLDARGAEAHRGALSNNMKVFIWGIIMVAFFMYTIKTYTSQQITTVDNIILGIIVLMILSYLWSAYLSLYFNDFKNKYT